MKDYDTAIRLKPDHVEAYYKRGDVRRDNGDIHGAFEYYETAIQLKPNFADAYYNRGNFRLTLGDVLGAVKDFTEAERLQKEGYLPVRD